MFHHLGQPARRSLTVLVALLTCALVLATPGSAGAAVRTPSHLVAKDANGSMKSYVHGTASNGRRVVGSFTPHKFVVGPQGNLRAVGKLNIVTRGPGRDLHRVKYGVSMLVKRGTVSNVGTFGAGTHGAPAAAPLGSCDILNLVLGPLDLNLLGLKVHLNQVVLNVVAATGAGALLGNLLCAVAGLLDGAGLLSQVSTLLNQILAALRL